MTEYRKLSTYCGERDRVGNRFLADRLLEVYAEHAVATSILLRGMAGFGREHHRRTDQSLTLSEDPPVTALAVDTQERIEALLDEVLRIDHQSMVTMERATLSPEPARLHDETKLTVYLGRRQRIGRTPAFVAICDLLHSNDIAGATALLGVDGTAHGTRKRARFLGRNSDVPMMVIAVGSGDRIAAVLPKLRAQLTDPLVTVERVQVCKRDGTLLASPHALPETDTDGLPLWQKIMVYSSESALHHGEPVHRAILRRLRASDTARGATAVRGIWGFHGARPPHGDQVLQLARNAPVTTVIVDRPSRIAAAFDVVDEVTTEHGLVTTELVPGAGFGGETVFSLARHAY